MTIRKGEVLSPTVEGTATRTGWVPLLLILLTGVLLRWIWLDRGSLWYDEGFTWWVAQQPVGKIIHIIRADTWPPLFYIIMHLWQGVFGDSEWALRAESALASTLTLGLGTALIWHVLPTRGARLFAAALLAVSVVQLQFARDVRCYATAGLLVVACLWTIIRCSEGGSTWWLAGYVLAGAALVYQHNVMWFFLACLHVTWLLWPGRRTARGRIADMAIGDLGIALLFAPWVPSLLHQFHTLGKAFWTQRPMVYELTETLPWLAGADSETVRNASASAGLVRDESHRLFRLGFLLIVMVPLAAALLATRGELRRKAWAVAAVACGPLVLGFIYSQFRQSIYIERVFSPSSVAMPLVIGMSLAVGYRYLSPLVRVCLACLLLAAMTSSVILLQNPPTEPWREAMAWLQEQQQPGDVALFHACEGELMYDYFAHRRGWERMPTGGVPRDFQAQDPPVVQVPIRSEADIDELRMRTDDPSVRRVWLIESHVGWIDRESLARRHFARIFRQGERREWPRIAITRFDR